MSRKYTFVTVAHHVDYEALCLQARSMVLYLPDTMIKEIIIVDNDLRGPAREHLKGMYGKLWKFVRIINRDAVSAPETKKLHGWISQQILKLEIAKHVKSDRYVVLDAKNALVNPLKISFLENPKGQPLIFRCDYRKHSSRRWLANVVRYLGIPNPIAGFVPTVTPFVLVTSLVKKMLTDVERWQKKPFWKVFVEKHLTEFFLYGAYLIKTNQFIYDWAGQECKVVFKVTSSERFVKNFIEQTERKQLPFFAVHRGAQLPKRSKYLVWKFWRSRGLRYGGRW